MVRAGTRVASERMPRSRLDCDGRASIALIRWLLSRRTRRLSKRSAKCYATIFEVMKRWMASLALS